MDMHRYAVLIKKPEHERLMGLRHAAKFTYFNDYTINVKNQLLEWLDARNLRAQVESVEDETVFNTLFFTATPDVERALAENPAVVQIAEDKPLSVDLMWTPDK